MLAVGQVSRIEGAAYWVLAAQVDRDHELGPMESAVAGVALNDRVVVGRLGNGAWILLAALPA